MNPSKVTKKVNKRLPANEMAFKDASELIYGHPVDANSPAASSMSTQNNSENKDAALERAIKTIAEYYPGAEQAIRTVIVQHRMDEAALETTMRAELEKPLGPPLPQLSQEQVAAIIVRGTECPWTERPVHRMSPFEWVRDHYGEWIPGLLQGHLKLADLNLYFAFTRRVSREGKPDWLDVPNEKEASLRRIPDTAARRERLIGRAYGRQASRHRRKAQRTPS